MSQTTKTLASAALAGIIAVGVGIHSPEAQAGKKGFEKCYGIAKKGMNDCGTAKHSCAAQAKTDGERAEWVYVPEGTCKKIVGSFSEKPASDKKS